MGQYHLYRVVNSILRLLTASELSHKLKKILMTTKLSGGRSVRSVYKELNGGILIFEESRNIALHMCSLSVLR